MAIQKGEKVEFSLTDGKGFAVHSGKMYLKLKSGRIYELNEVAKIDVNATEESVQPKTKVLLEWDGTKGKFKKYILNLALQQKTAGEEHYITSGFMGEM